VTNLAFTGVPLEPYWVLAVALDELAGSTNLLTGQTYHWRIRAKDNSDEYSD